MQKNTGVSGGGISRSRERNLDRELKRKEPNSRSGDGDICASIVKTSPFTKSAESRRNQEYRGGPQKTGNAKISSDSRTQDLISDKNEKLDFRGDRMEEHGGIVKDVDMSKGRQGNTLKQPSDGKNKYNRENNVANSDDSI